MVETLRLTPPWLALPLPQSLPPTMSRVNNVLCGSRTNTCQSLMWYASCDESYPLMQRYLMMQRKPSKNASEYISFITGEVNERCQREQRKTVIAEDVLWVMGKLGFDDYIEPLIIFDGSSLLEWNQSRRSSEGIYWICISKSQLSDG